MFTLDLRPLFLTVLVAGVAAAVALPAAADDRPSVLRAGEPMPRLEGDFLTGKPAVLPDAAKGKVALVALGFTYDSRFAVEAWGKWFKTQFGGRAGITYFEVPMMGRGARFGRFFIDRGMRKNTPKDAHDHVITVYGDTGPWKPRVGFTDAREKDAYLLLVGPDGVVKWMYSGPFDEAKAAALEEAVEGLLAAR
jgi:hypothetical protein